MAAGYAAGTTFGYTSLSGGDVFTAANLKIMCEMESIVVNNRQYQDYCRLLPPDYQQCAPQTMSILTVFGVDPQSCDITEPTTSHDWYWCGSLDYLMRIQ